MCFVIWSVFVCVLRASSRLGKPMALYTHFCHPEFFILTIYKFLTKHTVIIHVSHCAFYSWLSCRLHHIVFK